MEIIIVKLVILATFTFFPLWIFFVMVGHEPGKGNAAPPGPVHLVASLLALLNVVLGLMNCLIETHRNMRTVLGCGMLDGYIVLTAVLAAVVCGSRINHLLSTDLETVDAAKSSLAGEKFPKR